MRQKNINRQTSMFFILILLSFGFLGLDKFGWLNWLKRPIEIATKPIKRTIWQSFTSFKFQVSSFKFRNENDPVILQEKLKHLEQELTLLKVESEELKKENEKIRHLLGAPFSPAWQFLPAKVLGLKDAILIIGQGLDDRVKEGMAVLLTEEKVSGGILLGKIVKVNPRSSHVMLVSHRQSQIAGKVLSTGVKGSVVGSPEGKIILEQVLQKENLTKGQFVITTGEEEQFPPNLLLGQIEEIEKIETEIYQKAFLEPLVDFERLETVFIKL